MQSLLVPSSVSVFLSATHIRRVGPRGSRLRPLYPFSIRGRSTPEGRRLVVSLSETVDLLSSTERSRRVSTALSYLSQALYGVSRGYRRRLRLVGVGFRAVESASQPSVTSPITLKLGYSHDVAVPRSSRASEGITLTSSRLDGRSKGTILSLEGPDLSRLNHAAVTIRALRTPDSYKGKGIHFDREKLTLKKGKRET